MIKKVKKPLYDIRTLPVKQQISKLFWIISPAFMRWAECHLHTKGLTPQRVRVLITLIESGAMMMSELRDELGLSASNITALVDALEKDKMVTRKSHSRDRRATVITITPKAEKIIVENGNAFREHVSELFSGFSKTKQEQLLSLLLEVREALIKRDVLEECEFTCSASPKKESK